MKRATLIVVALVLFALAFVAAGALAGATDKPPSPPGQGPCGHGNSQKPCKEDPQPDKGKDCEEHGPKEGGVNEDHCKEEPSTPDITTTSPDDPPTSGSTDTGVDKPSSGSPAPETGSSNGGSTPSEPGVSTPPRKRSKPSPPVILNVTPGSTPEQVVVHLSDGTTRVGIKGQG